MLVGLGVGLDLGRVGLELLLLELLGLLHGLLDACADVLDADDDQAGLAVVELLTQILEVVRLMPAAAWPATAPSSAPPAVVPASSPAPIPANGNSAITTPVARPMPPPSTPPTRVGVSCFLAILTLPSSRRAMTAAS